VNSPENNESELRARNVLRYFRTKGVHLWSDNGQLRYKAPKGALTQDDIDGLRASRVEIVTFLEGANGVETIEPRLWPRRKVANRAPLALSQMAHWNAYELNKRRSFRQVISVTRLCGRLSVDALRDGVAEVVHRHDALRTRIVIVEGVPEQHVEESASSDMVLVDLSKLSDACREAEVTRLIEKVVLNEVDLAADPLYEVCLAKLRDDEYVLIVVMDHIIADARSMGIFLRDLFSAYMQSMQGRVVSFPPRPVQFHEFAARQRISQRSWIEKSSAVWIEHMRGYRHLRFPSSSSAVSKSQLGWGVVPVRIERDVKSELREWCRWRRTTIVMSVLTAYVGLVMRWCDVSEVVTQYITDGRVAPEVEDAIGFFASSLYLRTELFPDDRFVDLMNRTTGQYCTAFQHADHFSYAEAQVPRPDFSRNSVFNWVPQGSMGDLSDLVGSQDAIKISPVAFTHPMLKSLERDSEPVIALYDTDSEIVGEVFFPLNRFSRGNMERFGRNFVMFIQRLLGSPEKRVKDIEIL
jgi:hypothetical protein